MAGIVEKKKKELDIRTYKEILAFLDGKTLTEIEKAREEGKRRYQTVFIVLAVALFTVLISIVFLWIFG